MACEGTARELECGGSRGLVQARKGEQEQDAGLAYREHRRRMKRIGEEKTGVRVGASPHGHLHSHEIGQMRRREGLLGKYGSATGGL